jgi:hypothetical protein
MSLLELINACASEPCSGYDSTKKVMGPTDIVSKSSRELMELNNYA